MRDFAIELKKKFDNLLGGGENIPIEDEKRGLEQYGFDDDKYDLIMGDDGNYRVVPKNKTSNLGLTNYSEIANNNMNNNMNNSNNVNPIDPKNSSFDFSQYNDDETKKEIVMIEKTNTVIVG